MVQPNVTVEDVLAFTGETFPEAQVNAHIGSVSMLVYSYTRGRGFTEAGPSEDIRQVIISATARSIGNPTHYVNKKIGTMSHTPGHFEGFTLPEIRVLNRYRIMAG